MKQGRDDQSLASYVMKPSQTTFDLIESWAGYDEFGAHVAVKVVPEKPLTIYLNNQEIITLMTILDEPKLLALGFLVNQHMLLADDELDSVDYDGELDVVVVRTKRETDYESRLLKRVQTSGCAQGSSFGDLMDNFSEIDLPASTFTTSDLYKLLSIINRTPSLYLEAGAIHGCVLGQGRKPLVYTEDVGRHNAVDKIAGWLFECGEKVEDKFLYTTGRLTSEMVIKTVKMGIPVLISRSGFTGWAVELARSAGLLMIGRARGERFTVLSGEDRLVRDCAPKHYRNSQRLSRGEVRDEG